MILCGYCHCGLDPDDSDAHRCAQCNEWFEDVGTIELHEEEDREDFNASASLLTIRDVEN